MAFGVGRALTTPLAVLNFILYLIAAALAGWALNKYIDGAGFGNAATQWFLPIALIASVVGLASILAGTHHLRVYRTDSLSAAHAAALIAWLLTLLALGLAAKEIHIGGARGGRLLLYLLSLHSGLLGSNYGPTYNNAGTGTGVGPKAGNYGTPAAAAV